MASIRSGILVGGMSVALGISGALLSVPTVAAAASGPVYVAPSGSDTAGTGTAAKPYQTIAKALSVTAAGGTVVLEPGTYKQSAVIRRAVTLESDPTGGSPANTIVDATGQSVGITVADAGSAGTVIKGLTVEHADNHGIFVMDTEKVTIEDNVVTDNGLKPNKKLGENKAIQLVGTSNSLVADNTVTLNKADGGIGVADDGHIDPGAPTPGAARPGDGNTIRGNTLEHNFGGCAIVIAAYNAGEGVANNVVTANKLVDNVPGPIVVAADPPGTSATGNVVSDNTVTGSAIAGIIIHSNAPGQTVAGNVISGNTLSGNGADKQVKDLNPTGIVIDSTVVPVRGTKVSGNKLSHEYYGVWQSNAAGTVLSGNSSDATVTVPSYTAPAPARRLPNTGGNPLETVLGALLVLAGGGLALGFRRRAVR